MFICIIIFACEEYFLSLRLHLHFLPPPLVLGKLQLYEAKHGIEPKLDQGKVPAKGFKALYWENQLLKRKETEIWRLQTMNHMAPVLDITADIIISLEIINYHLITKLFMSSYRWASGNTTLNHDAMLWSCRSRPAKICNIHSVGT